MTTEVAFTEAVKAQQEKRGSRRGYTRLEERGGWPSVVTPDLAIFLAERDSFYLATASADGRPYIQHRGGPPGFLKVVDEKTLGFADFGGNRQYITLGNLSENPRAFIFLMDYPNRRRVKIWGHARVVEDDPGLIAAVAADDYAAGKPERAILFTIEAWDVNCPQHIVPRLSPEQVDDIVEPLRRRIADLEAELAALRAEGRA